MYEHVSSTHSKELPSIKLGEIIGVNPNSYQTIREVLQNLLLQAGVLTKREWVRIGFDGVPYRIAYDLIENTMQCDICKELIDIKVSSTIDHHVWKNSVNMWCWV